LLAAIGSATSDNGSNKGSIIVAPQAEYASEAPRRLPLTDAGEIGG
jgi:hypothetical protein